MKNINKSALLVDMKSKPSIYINRLPIFMGLVLAIGHVQAKSIVVTPNTQIKAIGYGCYYVASCTSAGAGSFTVTTPPKHGTLSFRTETITLATGNVCEGKGIPATVAYYTWTDGQSNAKQDDFALYYDAQKPNCTANDSIQIQKAAPSKNNGKATDPDCPKTCDGNPIDASTGNKFQTETDIVGVTDTGLEMRRFYNSQDSAETKFGTGWRGTWQQSISGLASSGKVQAIRPDGRVETFTKSTANTWQWLADPDVTNQLSILNDAAGKQTGWQLTTRDDEIEQYTLDGRLTTVVNKAGISTGLKYDSGNRLSTVKKAFSGTLTFAYDGNNRVSSIAAPDGGVTSYAYDASNNLVSATHPDKTVRKYLYENTTFVHALTGIIDENGKRFATWTYDAQGRATSSQHAGGAELTKIDYNTDGTATVTDARGNQHSYNFTTQFDVVKPTSVTGSAFKNMGAKAFTYDANGFVASKTDFNGNVTTYVRDARGLETSRTEASGSPLARTITTTWHNYYHLPTQITEPNRITSFVYDANGNMLQRTVTAGAISRSWKYTYQFGRVLTVDGPRTDVNDMTQLTYDSKNNLASITNPLGQVTQFTAYDANGRPLSFTDANGLVTSLTYDARGQLTSTKAGTELTTYTRDAVGQVTKITAPDGSFIALSYDDAHRLVKVSDQLGNHIDYKLDAESNRAQQDIYDPKANLTQSLINKFDSNNRLAATFGADGQKTLYGYDDNDNLVAITDPLGNKTQLSYDALNRLIRSIDAAGAVTKTAYDANDNLQSVTDPLNHQTQYGYDGLGNPLSVKSPDTGLSQSTYDSAGKRMSAVDAKNQKVQYSYDALNRLTKMVYDTNTTVSFAYDQGSNGKGHLTQMTEPAGTTSWTYDSHGRISSKTFAIGTVKLITRYGYNAAGLLSGITYPSGQVVQLAYSNGLVSSLSSGGQSLVSAIHYQPFGSAADWMFGNGVKTSRGFDLDGRITDYDLGERSRQLSYDAASRITGYKDTDMNYDQNYTYDVVNRLLGVSTPSTKTDYSYDANGNRTQLIAGSITKTSTLDAASNRLQKISQGTQVVKNYSYDAAGNIVGDGTTKFTYDGRGRLIKAVGSFGAESYSVNGLGQRVAKTLGVTSTYFTYDEAGHLLGEYDKLGKAIQETVWLGDMPVAMFANNVNYFVYADHLNAPRAIANSTGKVIWRWDGDAFGTTLANEDPDKNGVKFTYNLRFPGQYFDKSTGLHYNGFRDYDPAVGRYIESDPIGLRGGGNTYGYVWGNPNSYVDPSGRFVPLIVNCLLNPTCAGAIYGAGNYLIEHAIKWDGINTTDLLIATGQGAIAGSLGGPLMYGAGRISSSPLGASVLNSLTNGLVGATTGLIGAQIHNALRPCDKPMVIQDEIIKGLSDGVVGSGLTGAFSHWAQSTAVSAHSLHTLHKVEPHVTNSIVSSIKWIAWSNSTNQ